MDAGDVLYALGALAEAEANLRPAAVQLLASRDLAEVAKANARIAHCYLRQGRLEEARTILAEETVRVRESGARGYFARNVRTANAAAALLALERADNADRSGALKEAKTACRDLLREARVDTGALTPAYRMQGTCQWLCGHKGKATNWWGKSLEHAQKLGARYEGALTRLEMGRRLGDRTHLEAAEASLAEMGAAWDLAEARKSLQELVQVSQGSTKID
jgi:tetratricopeptide (TPR) repeat protein